MLEMQLLVVGPFANSLWTNLQMHCAQHDESGAANVPRGMTSLLGCFGESTLPVVSTLRPKVTSWFAHGSVQVLRFSAEADASATSSHVHCKWKNRMDYNPCPSTAYISTSSCPSKIARRQLHTFEFKYQFKYKHNQDHSLTLCPIITLVEFCSSSPFAALHCILPVTD